MKKILFILAAATTVALSSFTANAARIELLGETVLGNSPDFDTITVRSCRYDNEEVAFVKLRVLRDWAQINYLEVEYGNGERDTLNIRSRFNPGSETRWIDLNGSFRCLKKVRIFGESGGRVKKTLVQVWGLTQRR